MHILVKSQVSLPSRAEAVGSPFTPSGLSWVPSTELSGQEAGEGGQRGQSWGTGSVRTQTQKLPGVQAWGTQETEGQGKAKSESTSGK